MTFRQRFLVWVSGNFPFREQFAQLEPMLAMKDELDAKADNPHTHIISEVVGLNDALSSLPISVHTHNISDVTGLASALSAKAGVVHSHGISDVTGLTAALSSKANTSHTHAIADVTNLQTALDGKISKSPKGSSVANAATDALASSVTILGISVPTNSSYLDLVSRHNALASKINDVLSRLRSRDIIDA